MGLWDFVKSELIDIIEWTGDDRSQMVFRFDRHDNEIKNGAKLIVREGQVCAFVREGALADVFFPGTYTLETKNLPLLSTLAGWKYGFDSPFKAEAYFVSTRTFGGRKWGTKQPILLPDPQFGSVDIRAFGTYAIKVGDPASFLREVIGTSGRFDLDDLGDQLRNMVVSRFTDAVGEANLPVVRMAANYEELGTIVADKMQPHFGHYGLELLQFVVENISVPPELQELIAEQRRLKVLGADIGNYERIQAAEAMRDAAQNTSGGGAASDMAQMAMGIGMANNFMGRMQPGQQPQQTAGGPPPMPQAVQFYAAVNGQQVGPLDANGFQQKLQSGEITRDTLVWKNGMSDWAKAADVPDLQPLFASAPPPLPPSGGTPPPPPSNA